MVALRKAVAPKGVAPLGAASMEAASAEAVPRGSAPIGAAPKGAAAKVAARKGAASEGEGVDDSGLSDIAVMRAKSNFRRSVKGKSAARAVTKSVPRDKWAWSKVQTKSKAIVKNTGAMHRPQVGALHQIHQCSVCGRTAHRFEKCW